MSVRALNGQIIYTPFPNLKVSSFRLVHVVTLLIDQKTGDMATGQVSFHSDKKVKRGESQDYLLSSIPLRLSLTDTEQYMYQRATMPSSTGSTRPKWRKR
jgi:hypothetical protein